MTSAPQAETHVTPHRVTLQEIAREADVAPSTVSEIHHDAVADGAMRMGQALGKDIPNWGNSMRVARLDTQPGVIDRHRPQQVARVIGNTAALKNHHTRGQNVSFINGHAEFRRDSKLQQRYHGKYW